MDNAPPQLLLSALTWSGLPTTWTVDDPEEDHVGIYGEAAVAQLNKTGMNTQLGAVEYSPATTMSFRYTRQALIDTASSEITSYGGIAASNMPSLVRVSLPSRRPWPERFERPSSEGNRRLRTGHPFFFWDTDWDSDGDIRANKSLSNSHTINLSPDLPGQSARDVQPTFEEGLESDSWVGLGWHGDWVTALLERRDHQQPLGERTEIVWSPNHAWGVQVRLQALNITEMDPEMCDEVRAPEDHSRGISDYDVQATILRVFVKSEEFIRLQESDVVQEEDSDSDEAASRYRFAPS
ncbi:hypothetical protein DFH06DRAFT_1353465 [Mycena polygramma]|nr:hypothetical protein DFH06DRAFT_1353465 [Mycena polygramma]